MFLRKCGPSPNYAASHPEDSDLHSNNNETCNSTVYDTYSYIQHQSVVGGKKSNETPHAVGSCWREYMKTDDNITFCVF